MGGPAHASSAAERLPPPSRFSRDGNSYGVGLENRNRCATFTNRQGRENRDGSAAYMGIGPPMTIASPELQTPCPGRSLVLQV